MSGEFGEDRWPDKAFNPPVSLDDILVAALPPETGKMGIHIRLDTDSIAGKLVYETLLAGEMEDMG